MLPNKVHIDQSYRSSDFNIAFLGKHCYPGSSICHISNPTKADFAPYHLCIHEPRQCLLSLYYSSIVGYDDPRTAPALSDLLPCTTPILQLQKKLRRQTRASPFLLSARRRGTPQHTTGKGRKVPSCSTCTYGTRSLHHQGAESPENRQICRFLFRLVFSHVAVATAANSPHQFAILRSPGQS